MTALPAFAALRHHTAREGFEVVFPRRTAAGHRFEGESTGVEDGRAWTVHYEIDVDGDWISRAARITARTAEGTRSIELVAEDGWRIDGTPAPELDGCLDVDLEASALTNAFPVRRLGLAPGDRADAPAAWVRLDLTVERLEQRYACTAPGHFDYEAPGLGFTAQLVYDAAGLILAYPGIASRAA